MYVAKVPNRGSPPAILIREGYREGGKVKTRTLANISKLPPQTIDAIDRSLKGQRLLPPEEVFEILQDGSAAHGHVEAVMTAMRRLRLDNLIASRPSRMRDLVLAMVAVRILVLEPPSKLATARWWHGTTLPDLLGVTDADQDELYEAMDWLLERQPTIEKKLAARHLEDKGLVLYDLSSTYFEGVTCPLAARGHNRDGKQGKLQVNWGLLTNRQGIPVSISLFDGNTNDTKTLLPQVTKMRESFGFEHFVMVGDRGMIMQKQINTLEDIQGVDWVTALPSAAIRKLVEKKHLQLGLFDERNLFEIRHPDFDDQRLIACRNPELARHRMHKRESLLQATCELLHKVQKMTQHGRIQGKEAIETHVRKAVGSSKVGRLLRWQVRDDGFDISVDEKAVVSEATRTTMRGLDELRARIKLGQLTGQSAIQNQVTQVLSRRKVGRHFQVSLSGDHLEVSVDKQAVLFEALAPVTRRLYEVRKRIRQGQLHGKDAIALRIGKVIDRHKVAKHFVLDIRHSDFSFSIDKKKVETEAALDGVYVVRTSLPKDKMDAAETVRSYKLLTRVERAIRSMKTIDLRVRPIHHRYEHRVRAHFFLCMLAYYVEWHMIEAWRPLLFCDEDQAAKATRDPVRPATRSEGARRKAATKVLEDGTAVHSFHTLLEHLSAIVRNTCRRVGASSQEPTFQMTTPPNPKQQQAYDLLKTISL
mgnify:CR=1 FL=1